MTKIKLNDVSCKIINILLILLLSGCASIRTHKTSNDGIETIALSSQNTRVAAEILRVDIEQLVKLITEIHPEPFAIITQKDFIRKAQAIKSSIRYPLSRGEFYLRVAPLLAMLGDIHSRLAFPEYKQNNKSDNSMNNRLFPLAVLYETNGLYVAADLSSYPRIPTGALITSINDAPVNFLLQVMHRITAKETDAGQRRRIQVDFPWLLSVMGYARSNYKIVYQWRGKEVSTTIIGISPPSKNLESNDPLVNSDPDVSSQTDIASSDKDIIKEEYSSASFYGFSQLTSQTALLWFNDFNEDPQVFASFLDQQFEQLGEQGLTNLIIDVRYNDGGLSQNISELLSHLNSKPVYWAKSGEIKISQPLKQLHQNKTKQRRKNKYTWGLQWLPLEWTDYLQYEISWSDSGETISAEFEAIEPSGSVVPAKVTVLTNGFCFSACSSFVAAVNQYGLANTIGEITGSFAKVQYAYPIKTKLPHSQLNLILPTMKLMIDPSVIDRKAIMTEKGSLITPDTPVERSRQQIIERQDAVLNSALRQIESGISQ